MEDRFATNARSDRGGNRSKHMLFPVRSHLINLWSLSVGVATAVMGCASFGEPTDHQVEHDIASDGSADARSVVALSVTDGYGCKVTGDGTLKCWKADAPEFENVTSGNYMAVSSSIRPFPSDDGAHGHLCAVKDGGVVKCRGDNSEGESSPPDREFVDIAVGDGFSCGLTADKQLHCWGRSYEGQLEAPGGKFDQICVGTLHACAIHTDQTVSCWGYNDRGQADAPPGKFAKITAGNGFSCGIRPEGSATCWGLNNSGQTKSPEGEFSRIAAGTDIACGLRDDRTVECWGGAPVEPKAPDDEYHLLDVGTRGHICGVTAEHDVVCWGLELREDGETRIVPGAVPDI